MKLKVDIAIRRGPQISVDSLKIENNKINFLFGESGIGKTLISKALLGLLKEEEYVVTIDNEPYEKYLTLPGVKDIIDKSFYVFQEPSAHLSPVRKIEEQLEEGSLGDSDEIINILRELFPELNEDELNRLLEIYPKPFRPSGGEKQRFLNAMGLIKISKLVRGTSWNAFFVFDEPTGHLDVEKRNLLIKLLLFYYVKNRPTILIITHDYSVLSMLKKSFSSLEDNFAYHELFLEGGRIKQRLFSEDEYFTWIIKEKRKKKPPAGSETILRVKTGIKVFNGILRFYSDKKLMNVTDLVLRKGEIVYLKAPSGTGKTTVGKILLGLIKADFEYEINGVKVTGKKPTTFFSKEIWGRRITMAFQHADECLNPNATVASTLEIMGKSEAEFTEELRELFPGSNIEQLLGKKIKSLSGGEKQKINLLRAFLADADVTMLDEPTNGMDLSGVETVIKIIRKNLKKGKTYLLVSHSEDIFSVIVRRENIVYLKREND